MTKLKKENRRVPFIRRGATSDMIWLEDLRGAVWNSYNVQGLTWKEIAEYRVPFLMRATVSKFAYGETKQPRFTTVFRIAEALGITIRFDESSNK